EPTRVAGLAQEAPGSGGIIGGGLERQRKLEAPGNDRAGQTREAERLRLVQGLSIDRDARRLADALVVPGRFGVPLIGKVHPEDAKCPWRDHPQIWCAADLLGDGTAALVDVANAAPLESRGPSRLLRQSLDHEPPDVRRLPPVAIERLGHQFDAGRVRDEPERARADGRLLEALVADLL